MDAHTTTEEGRSQCWGVNSLNWRKPKFRPNGRHLSDIACSTASWTCTLLAPWAAQQEYGSLSIQRPRHGKGAMFLLDPTRRARQSSRAELRLVGSKRGRFSQINHSPGESGPVSMCCFWMA